MEAKGADTHDMLHTSLRIGAQVHAACMSMSLRRGCTWQQDELQAALGGQPAHSFRASVLIWLVLGVSSMPCQELGCCHTLKSSIAALTAYLVTSHLVGLWLTSTPHLPHHC